MNLSKGLMGAMLLGCTTGAFAQSSVTLYGIMDAAVERLSNTASGGGMTRMASATGSAASRVGFRGSEDLGNGLKTDFTMEMGIAPDSGVLNQGGRLFGRQAWVGLTGNWGTVSLGRQYTMLFWSLGGSDNLGGNLYSIGAFDSYLPNARTDNSVAYRGTFGGFTMGATYSLGRDTVNAGPGPSGTNCPGENPTSSSQCREWSLMLKYDAPQWGVAGAVDELRGGPGAFAGLNSASMKDRRSTLNGYVRFGDAKLGGGVIMRDNDGAPLTPRSNLWYLGVTYVPTTQWKLDAQLGHMDLKSSSNDATLYMARAMYYLSKRTAVYASASYVRNKGQATFSASGGQAGGNPSPGASQTAVALGIHHSF